MTENDAGSIPDDFQCEYADGPGKQCPMCDCFVLTHPDSPFALHPEDFTVGRVIPPGEDRDT